MKQFQNDLYEPLAFVSWCAGNRRKPNGCSDASECGDLYCYVLHHKLVHDIVLMKHFRYYSLLIKNHVFLDFSLVADWKFRKKKKQLCPLSVFVILIVWFAQKTHTNGWTQGERLEESEDTNQKQKEERQGEKVKREKK